LLIKPEGNKVLGSPLRRWGDNIRKDLREIGWKLWTGFIWLRIGTSDESSFAGGKEAET
jgi:hypothetical protein